MQGKYKLRVIGVDGKCSLEHSQGNIITTKGLNLIVTGYPNSTELAIGIGRATESVNTPSLANQVLSFKGTWSVNFRDFVNLDDNTITTESTFIGRTVAFTANNIITELGFVNGADLFTYSLLRTTAGVLTTVVINEGEVLEVEYTISQTVPYKQAVEIDEPKISNVYTQKLPAWHEWSTSSNNTAYSLDSTSTSNLELGIKPPSRAMNNTATLKKTGNDYEYYIPPNLLTSALNGLTMASNANNQLVLCFPFDEPFKIPADQKLYLKYKTPFKNGEA